MGTTARSGNTITTRDGTRIYFKDWGSGPPIVFCHGWPLSADAWDAQMLFFTANGFRCIAHDRRGHGRSSQPSGGNDMDTYADDLAELVDALDLDRAMFVGHSTGGGEVTRYIGRHGTRRVAKAVLVSAVPPLLLKSHANPGGIPIEVFDDIRAGMRADRSQLWHDFASGPFFGANRPGSKVSRGTMDQFWLQSIMGGHKNQYECVRAFSETDFTADLARFDVPTLLVHGDDDQVVPISVGSQRSVKLIRGARLEVYPGAPHGLAVTHADRLNEDLLAFFRAPAEVSAQATQPRA